MTDKSIVDGMEEIDLMDDLSAAFVPSPGNKVEIPLTGSEPTSSHEKDEATKDSNTLDSVRPQFPKITEEQKQHIMALLPSVIGGLDKAGNPLGHCVRLTALAEACVGNRLPDQGLLKVLAHVEPNEIYHVLFTKGTSKKEWVSLEEAARGEWDRT